MKKPDTAPLVDVQLLESHRKNAGPALFEEVLREFDLRSPEYTEAFYLALQQDQIEAAKNALHRLGGTAGMLGLRSLHDCCVQLERSLVAMPPAHRDEAAQQMAMIYNKTAEEIAEYRVRRGIAQGCSPHENRSEKT